MQKKSKNSNFGDFWQSCKGPPLEVPKIQLKKVRDFGKIEGENFRDQQKIFPEVKGVVLGFLWVCSFRKMGWLCQENSFSILKILKFEKL